MLMSNADVHRISHALADLGKDVLQFVDGWNQAVAQRLGGAGIVVYHDVLVCASRVRVVGARFCGGGLANTQDG